MKIDELKEPVDNDLLEEGKRVNSKLQIIGIDPSDPNYDKYVERIKDLRHTDLHAYHKAINLD